MKVILLAAGFSSRMGQLKQVMPLNGTPMIHHAAEPFIKAGLTLVIVLGHERDRVKSALLDLPYECIINPHPENGMFSSVQLGCRQIEPGEGCLLSTCDCPGILPGTIEAVRHTLTENPENVIVPAFNGRRGHPAGLPALLVKKIQTLPSSTPGLNSLWHARPEMLHVLEVGDPAVLRDLDRPKDVERSQYAAGGQRTF